MVDDTNIVKVSTNQGFTNMTNVTTNTVFEAFIEADKAMKELPAIKEELSQTKQRLEDSEHEQGYLGSKLDDANELIAHLKASLSTKEAELARATFRADAVEAKHRALRGILGGDDSPSVAVDGALSEASKPSGDEVAPKPNEMGQGDSNPTPQHAAGAHDGVMTHTATAAPSGQSDADPTHIETKTGTSSESQPENPTSQPTPSNNPSVEGSVSADPTESDVASTANNGQQSAGSSGVGEQTNASGDGKIDSSHPSHLAYAGRLYTSKPDGMEWGYWIVNGGEPAYWMNSDYIADLKSEYSAYAGHANAA